MENVTKIQHPLIEHKMSILRDVNTKPEEFRRLVKEISGPTLKIQKKKSISNNEKLQDIDEDYEVVDPNPLTDDQ